MRIPMNDKLTKAPATVPDSTPSHHLYGPSRWPALAVCPRWTGRQAGADAARGTALHERFARAVQGGEVPPAADFFDTNADALASRLRELAGGAPVEVEVLLAVAVPPGAPDLGVYGRADAVWQDGASVHVADLKSCHNPDRDYRPQLLAYASAFFDGEEAVERIYLHTLYADTGELVTEDYTIDEARRLHADNYKRVVEIAGGEVQDGPMQSGWCALCAHFEACAAPREVAVAVRDSLADVPERWGDFSPERKAGFCVLAEAVSKWADAVKKRAAEDAKGGIPIEDETNGIFFGLQQRAGRLAVDTVRAWEAVQGILSPEVFKAALDVNQTRLVDALKGTGMKPKEARALVESCGERGAPSVAFVRLASRKEVGA